MKSYTDLNQSKKFAEILPLESADMGWNVFVDETTRILPINDWDLVKNGSGNVKFYPAWSLAALFSMLPKSAYLEKSSSTELCRLILPLELISSDWNLEPIDVCVEMILKLHEEKLI